MIDWWFSIIWNPGDRPVTVWTGQYRRGDRRGPYTRQTDTENPRTFLKWPAAWPNGYGVRLRIGRLRVRIPSWSMF